MKRILATALLLVLTCTGLCTAGDEMPVMPHDFYGIVYVGDQPAPAGVSVEARGTGITVPSSANPVLTGSGGAYGAVGFVDPKLGVQGTVAELP